MNSSIMIAIVQQDRQITRISKLFDFISKICSAYILNMQLQVHNTKNHSSEKNDRKQSKMENKVIRMQVVLMF